jgi:hypothetical protein
VLNTLVVFPAAGVFFLSALCPFDCAAVGMVDLLGKPVGSRTPKGSIPRWAVRYGYSERAVKKFLAIGKAARDPVPFEEPEKMQDWGTRHLGKLTRRFLAGIDLASGKEPTTNAETETDAVPMDLPEVHESEMGMEMQLAGYRREFAMLAKLRETALRAGEFSRASNYFDQQQKVSSEIRQLERLLPTVLEQRGDYQRSSVVRAATVEFLTVLKRSLLGRAGKAASRLRAASSDAELQDAWRLEINAVFRECCAGGFTETLTLE